MLDEVNKYPPFAGKEANPIDLAIKRTTTYWDRKIVMTSTSTTPEGYISVWYVKSNKQQYCIPCPHCGEFSVWEFAQLKCPKELRDPDLIRALDCVWYECEFCKDRTEEYQKAELTMQAIWIPEGQKIIKLTGSRKVQVAKTDILFGYDKNEYAVTGHPLRDKRISGFNYSALISPWVSWPEIMAQWFEANTPEGIAIGKLMDFRNNIQAADWIESGKKAEEKDLRKLIGTFSKGTVPPECRILVCGADYHEDQRGMIRIDYEVRAFGYNQKNRIIQSGSAASWAQFDDEVLLQPFPWADGTPNEERPWLAVVCAFIDSGYMPEEVYKYCMQRPWLTISTKGASGKPRTPIVRSKVETASQVTKRYWGQQLFIIDTEFFKDQVTSWALEIKDDTGNITKPALTKYYNEIPDYYFREFANEHKVKVRDSRGREHWQWQTVRKGAPTHFMDTAVLAAAAAFYKKVHYMTDPAGPKIAEGKRKMKLSDLQKRHNR